MKTLLLTLLTFLSLQLKAQTWVQVPDANFQSYLTAHYPASAFMISGGNFFVDSDHTDIQVEDSLEISGLNISSIDGVEAFVNLINLNCYNNQISVLPALPSTLEFLDCSSNQLSSLPALPGSLYILLCKNNLLTTFAALPPSLVIFGFDGNQVTTLPALPSSLNILSCSYNLLTELTGLPTNLQQLICSNNQLINLPVLPPTLFLLFCDSIGVSTLPALPSTLHGLTCRYNGIIALPQLPGSLNNLSCDGNQLTGLPAIPAGLVHLDCMDNQIHCFEPFPVSLIYLSIEGNPFTCLPNYIPNVGTNLLMYPLCDANDPVNNPAGCTVASGMQGTVFNDVNANCINTGQALSYIPMLVYDSLGTLMTSSTSLIDGNYFFTASQGTYALSIDTANLTPALHVTCPAGNSSGTIVSASDTVVSGGDFGLVCNGFDLGVQSIVHYGLVFPGQTHELAMLAGDVTGQYNMDCASGITGEVSVSVTGPGTVVFGGSPTNVSGNTAVYSIADFGAPGANAFTASMLTDTTAHAGEEFCVTVSVNTNTSGELDVTNNSYSYCYQVVNSYDPNIKETSPEGVEPGYQDEFTYTIYFQNTGNAPAINIRLADTLDLNLDLSTFKVVNASHTFSTTVNAGSRLLTVRFPNIMLPDSVSDPQASIGFIQYRVKPVAGLLDGTIIKNTAYIYFDFNTPIVTNTSENLFSETAGFTELIDETIQLYPNPSNNQVFIRSDNTIEQVMLYDLNGMLVKTVSPNAKNTSINVSGLKSGMYIATVQTNQSIVTKRLIVR
ncbi:MAG: hypothetical protein K0S23_3471 [Fluviicola sp.]|jgi:uncharacterized repeat protein (TIGR01451 family)|uniref:DUF7619 domain-containing protein n=1 Tax=Fluviicola sp. TaxID=1917219 RepID=UPI002634C744|nr:T9SS type A sorting domain-containing protein [Fluviicola sp.]MDF3029164.1 hypothetical protein [Fluviicola sp.]